MLYLSADKSRVAVRKQLANWHFQNISEHRNTAPYDHRGLGTTVVLASTSTSVKTTITPLKEIKNRKSLHVQLYYKATTTRGFPSNYVRQWAGSTMLSYFLIFCNAVEMRLFGFKFVIFVVFTLLILKQRDCSVNLLLTTVMFIVTVIITSAFR